MQKLIAISMCCAALACGGVEGDESWDDDGLADDGVASLESEATVAVPFTVVAFDVPSAKGQSETRKLFKTAASFQAYFGVTAASAGLDFTRDWAIFYSAGVKRSGGYTASIASVRVTTTGKTFTTTTSLESPGAGCLTTSALTKPAVLVKLKKQRVAPTSSKFVRADRTRSCERLTCAELLCAAGSFCSEANAGVAECLPYSTCLNVRCASGTHCENRPIVCSHAPCPPTAPACLPN